MSRRKLLVALGSVVAILLTGGITLGLLLHHEKSYYAHLTPPPGSQRKKDSQECFHKLTSIYGDIQTASADWGNKFSEKELNSYLCEDFESSGMSELILPEDIRDPRICLEDNGVVRLGFRYGKRPWQTLITVELRVWLATDEPNAVCLEMLGLYAGGLPISTQSLMQKFFDGLRRQNIDVAWYSYHGHHTAVLRFQSDQSHPMVELTALTIDNGALGVGGKSVEPAPPQ